MDADGDDTASAELCKAAFEVAKAQYLSSPSILTRLLFRWNYIPVRPPVFWWIYWKDVKKNGLVIVPDPAAWLQVVAAGGYEFKGAIAEAVSDFLSELPTGSFITTTVVGTSVIALKAVLPASQDFLELDVLPGVVSVHKVLNVSIHMQDVAGKSFVQKLTSRIEATRQFILDRVLEVTKENALGSVKLSQNGFACILGQKTSTT